MATANAKDLARRIEKLSPDQLFLIAAQLYREGARESAEIIGAQAVHVIARARLQEDPDGPPSPIV